MKSFYSSFLIPALIAASALTAAAADDSSSTPPDQQQSAMDRFKNGEHVGYVGGARTGYEQNVYRHYIYNVPAVVVPGAPIKSGKQRAVSPTSESGPTTISNDPAHGTTMPVTKDTKTTAPSH